MFLDSSNTPLPLAFDTFPLGGNVLHVRGKVLASCSLLTFVDLHKRHGSVMVSVLRSVLSILGLSAGHAALSPGQFPLSK